MIHGRREVRVARRLLVLTVVVIGMAAGVMASRLWLAPRGPGGRGQIELFVSAPPGMRVSLYRAGSTLESTQELSITPGGGYVNPVNHFVQIAGTGAPLLFPVPLADAHAGPDSDGSFAVVVRAPLGIGRRTAVAAGSRSCPAGTF